MTAAVDPTFNCRLLFFTGDVAEMSVVAETGGVTSLVKLQHDG